MYRFLLITLLCGIHVYSQMLGPALITLKRMEKCGEDSLGVVINFQMRKFNRTHYGTDFNFTIPFDLDQKAAINITAAKWGDGGWKPNYFDLADDYLCKLLTEYGGKPIYELLELFKQPPKCPLVAGTYGTKDYIFDGYIDKPVVYGDFRADFRFLRDNIVFGCVRIFANTAPKTNGFSG